MTQMSLMATRDYFDKNTIYHWVLSTVHLTNDFSSAWIMNVAVVLLLLAGLANFCVTDARYQPNWDSLDTRPLPTWYDDYKIGIFLHWGLFSVPSLMSEWFWMYWRGSKTQKLVDFMNNNYKPNFTYEEFGPSFTAEFYNPDEWADIFSASGARYVVLTSKHHEGYTMWPSNVSWNWNVKDLGPHRDLLGDLANAVRKRQNMKFGVYHSLYEWFNPIYLQDKANKWTTRNFVERKTMPELNELVMQYKPEIIWSDGDWEAYDTYWNSTGFIAWLYNDSPVRDSVVVNDRWGIGVTCKHGDFLTCQDRYNPGKLQNKKWENAMTLDKHSWGYVRDSKLGDYLTTQELIQTLAETIAYGGNLLINVGPTHDGRIVPIFEERLRDLGKWLKVNGEAIYSTKPWKHQNDTLTPLVWYTMPKNDVLDTVYVLVLQWPKRNLLSLGDVQIKPGATVNMLGVAEPLTWTTGTMGETIITFPALTPDVIPCQWAWVLKVTGTVM